MPRKPLRTYVVKHQQTKTYAVTVQARNPADAKAKALRKRSQPIEQHTRVLDVWRRPA